MASKKTLNAKNLEALGASHLSKLMIEITKGDVEAQDFRWSCFKRSLNAAHLRSYLKHLPDFDDMEAEDCAFVHVLQYPSFHQSLSFLVSWPSLDKAEELVLSRTDEFDGDHYEV